MIAIFIALMIGGLITFLWWGMDSAGAVNVVRDSDSEEEIEEDKKKEDTNVDKEDKEDKEESLGTETTTMDELKDLVGTKVHSTANGKGRGRGKNRKAVAASAVGLPSHEGKPGRGRSWGPFKPVEEEEEARPGTGAKASPRIRTVRLGRKAGDRRLFGTGDEVPGAQLMRRVWDLLFMNARNATSKVALAEVVGEMVSLVEGIGGTLVVAGLRRLRNMEERGQGLEERLKSKVGTLTTEAVKALQGLRVDLLMGMNPEVLEGDRVEVDRLVREFNSRWRKMGAGLRVRDLREGPPVGHYVDPSRRVG